MRKAFLLILFLSELTSALAQSFPVEEDSMLIKQDICYLSEEAREVFMVWGINNWNIPATKFWPEGSFVKDHLLYTPMKKGVHGFYSSLKLKKNTMVDYVFFITSGPAGKAVNIWDRNKEPQKNYHTLSISTSTVMITSKVAVRPKEMISILDFSSPLLSLSTTLYLLFLLIRKTSGYMFRPAGYLKIIVASGIVTALFLAIIRSSVTGQCWDLYLHPVSSFPKILWAAFYDVAYILVLAVIFLLLALSVKTGSLKRYISLSFAGICILSIIAGILNIRLVETLGKPFNYPWFYYSGFLKVPDTHSELLSDVSSAYVLQIIMVCISAVFLWNVLIMISEIFLEKFQLKKVILNSFVCCSMAYITIAPRAIQHYNWEYTKLANPVVAFAGSDPFSMEIQLFTMNVKDSMIKKSSMLPIESTAGK